MVTIEEQIKEVERELALRRNVYRAIEGRLFEQQTRQMERMVAVLATLREVAEMKPQLRVAVGDVDPPNLSVTWYGGNILAVPRTYSSEKSPNRPDPIKLYV